MLFERSMKRNAGVPRGLLRFLVLKYLVEKPMTGVEIVETIEAETGGKWKPSSGSIYPLLGWLQDKGSLASYPRGRNETLLSYRKGKRILQRTSKSWAKVLRKNGVACTNVHWGFDYGADNERLLCAKESAKKVLETFIELDAKRERLTKQNIEEIARILDNSNSQLRKIVEKINEAKPVRKNRNKIGDLEWV